ncbi:hypothetical protein F2Q68_00043243 [Brassica cretica]|uniref:Uncharacterized protein n=1 Tax=Brassica cretica TaxID=69181 RepID=A0A8S9LKM0_BRACR|nr:hypothetical protein F2Q68_00043243 [Brassica cretica]
MVRTKKMAKHNIAVTSWTHAGGTQSLNTAHEKEPSEESDDQHASSVREEVQINKVNVTFSDPAATKPLSDPLKTVSSESNRSATQDPITDSLLLLCHEEKERSGEGKE